MDNYRQVFLNDDTTIRACLRFTLGLTRLTSYQRLRLCSTTKERLKQAKFPRLSILQNLGMNRFQGWLIGFSLRQGLVCIVPF